MAGTAAATRTDACLRVVPSGMLTLMVGALTPLLSSATSLSYGSFWCSVYVPGLNRVA